MKKNIIFLAVFFFALSVCLSVHADSIQDRLFKELDKKLKRYECVDFQNIKGVDIYTLNLKGTNLNIVEAYLRVLKDEIVFHERTEDGRWIKRVLKKFKSKHT